MDDMASTRAEANDHLQRLREARGIKGNDNDISDGVLLSSLNESLNIISDQLYTTPTHFLLELIQNADDNTYASGVVPRLHLALYRTVGKEIFRTDCNEIGFTFGQLDALTRIGKSTKKAVDGRKGYIGEKGIGFKSVFKVADVVHVASGCYEFKFNRRNTIGMMLPIASDFPSDDRVKDHTQFLLELERNEDYIQIGVDLGEIRPESLLFLRKLKQLDVSINGERKTYRLQTENWSSVLDGETARISEITDQKSKTTEYMIERGTVEDLPPDPRREGVATSEVVVAFAVKNQTTPIVNPQEVFAFLPVENYGFPFLIHADFLLTASRESLEYNCPWNLAMRQGIKDAVVKAIHTRFVHLDDDGNKGLCYNWPMYLTWRPSSSRFWNTLQKNILDSLRIKKILRSRDKQAARDLQKPTDVRYVPEAYRFEGETLFDLDSINKTHLSFVYDHVYEPLRSLGVSQLSASDLCEEFCQWVGSVGIAGIKEMPDTWHSKVAEIFNEKAVYIKQKLKQLPIIPLRDGSWVTAMKTHLYLPSPNKNELVPSGINISIVADDPAREVSRRKLYQYLDIKEYNPHQVCSLILDLHRTTISHTGRSKEDLINDATYLFRHRSIISRNYHPLNIFFAVYKDGKITATRSRWIYLVDPQSKHCMIAKYKDTPGNPFATLCDGYEAAFLKNGDIGLFPDFRGWLLHSGSVFTTIPDLVWNSRLTPEWKFLRDQNVLDLLYVVRDQLSRTLFPTPKLVEAVPRLEVRCLDGKPRTLGGLAVPTLDLKRHCPHLDFADVPEPTSQNWEFLWQFGVIVELDTTAILRELQALRGISVGDVDATAVSTLYQALNSDTVRSKSQIVRAFESQPLVFVPKPKPRWLSHKDCVWTAPKLLTQVTKLITYYRDCAALFQSLLGVREAGTQHVVDEFCEPSSNEDKNIVQHFKEMLSLLERFHRKSRLTTDQKVKIRSSLAFPILPKGFTPAEGLSRIEMCSLPGLWPDKVWYIPDKVTFEAAFRGKVDILALSVKTARAFSGLFRDLWCEKEFLSVAVMQSVKLNGIAVPNFYEEQALRERLKYISWVVEDNINGKIPKVSPIRVWSVPSIAITMSLDDLEVVIDDELVTINESADNINIYLREGTHESRQSEVAHELTKHFKQAMGFDESLTAFIQHLMQAPVHTLPGILDKHDIPLPEGSHDDVNAGSSEETHDPEDSKTLVQEGKINSNDSDGYHDTSDNEMSIIENSPSARTIFAPTGTGTSAGAERQTRCEGHQHLTPLRELIPSHQLRSESIIRRASNFRLSHAEAAVPIQDHSESGTAALHVSLPIRTRTPRTNADQSSDSSPPGMAATGRSHGGSLRARPGTGGGYPSLSGRRESVVTPRGGTAGDDTSEIRAREIGFIGELFVFEMFSQQIGADWTFECWTSHMRTEAGHPPFRGHEGDFSDFTYIDASGRMRAVLRDAGVEPSPAWSNATKFRLEVKSTLGPCAEPMFVSQNQVDMMRKYDGTADNAYILLRVFDLGEGRDPGVKFFRDPWRLYMHGVLDFRSERSYKVYH